MDGESGDRDTYEGGGFGEKEEKTVYRLDVP